MTKGNPIPLRLISHLQHAFSHIVRTPLSVISNDLHYSKTTGEPLDSQSIDAQCTKILDILQKSQIHLPSQEPMEDIAILEQCRACGIAISDADNDVIASGSKALFAEAFLHIGALSQWTAGRIKNARAIFLHTPVEYNQTAHFSLFSEAFNEILSRDTIHAPLADAACAYLGLTVAGTLSKGALRIELTIADE